VGKIAEKSVCRSVFFRHAVLYSQPAFVVFNGEVSNFFYKKLEAEKYEIVKKLAVLKFADINLRQKAILVM